jgi:hypothetical protein
MPAPRLTRRQLDALRGGGWAPTEAEFTRAVIRYAKLHGCRAAHFRPGMDRRGNWKTAVQGDGVGFPDLLLLKNRRLIVIELKIGRRKPTAEQAAWLDGFRLAGVPALVLTPESWQKVEEVLGAES